MGDAHITAEEAIYNFDMALFYKNDWKISSRTGIPKMGIFLYFSPSFTNEKVRRPEH
jgi:hypothetical protein